MRIHRDPALIAYRIAEETRALIAATAEAAAFKDPAAVRDVVEGVQLAVDQLAPALRQLSAGLRHLEETRAIRPDDATQAAQPISTALRALLNAEVGATITKAAMREAAPPLAALTAASSSEVGA